MGRGRRCKRCRFALRDQGGSFGHRFLRNFSISWNTPLKPHLLEPGLGNTVEDIVCCESRFEAVGLEYSEKRTLSRGGRGGLVVAGSLCMLTGLGRLKGGGPGGGGGRFDRLYVEATLCRCTGRISIPGYEAFPTPPETFPTPAFPIPDDACGTLGVKKGCDSVPGLS